MEKFIWSVDKASIEFSNGQMQYFNELEQAKNIDDALYFYYHVLIKVGKRRLKFTTYDFPKVHHIPLCVKEIIEHDTKNKGYLLEDFHDGDFYRIVHYHQIELNDTFWMEYFIRIEKYVYEVKQPDEEKQQEWTTYKVTIGRLEPYQTDTGVAWFINDIGEGKLKELAQVAEDFVKYSIKENNIQVEERRDSICR